jgi:hypothetical protein
MAINTYATLKTAIASFLNRDDLTTAIADFITLSEAKFNRTLRVRQMIKRATATIDTRYFAMPSDFLEAKTLLLQTNPSTYVEYATQEYIEKAYQDQFIGSGKPQYFGIIGTQFEVAPVPDTSYTGELTYYGKIDSLSDSTTTNWLLTYAPDLYLYGSLVQSAPYLMDDARIATWGQFYTSAMDDILVADQRSSAASTPIIRAKSLG